MRHDRATRSARRPKPDERNPIEAMRLKRKKQKPFHQIFHCAVQGPTWERDVSPAPEPESLHLATDRHGQQGPDPIVEFANGRSRGSAGTVQSIPFAPQVLYYLSRIKR